MLCSGSGSHRQLSPNEVFKKDMYSFPTIFLSASSFPTTRVSGSSCGMVVDRATKKKKKENETSVRAKPMLFNDLDVDRSAT